MLEVTLHGVRGSRPRHRDETFYYGGNSTCLEFHTDSSFYLFVDGGSGLIKRGQDIMRQKKAERTFNFLMTHTHWDHILALPYFEPLFDETSTLNFYAGDTSRAKFEELFHKLFDRSYLGYSPERLRAKINFHPTLPNATFSLSPEVTVETFQLNHQGVTLSYRVRHRDHSAVIVTDHAPLTEQNLMGEGMTERAKGIANFPELYRKEFVAYLKDSDLVVYDTHFTEANLKMDWGHSTPERALAICAEAGVKTLALFHHAPEDTKQDVDLKLAGVVRKGLKAGIKIIASREGYKWSPA